MTTEPNPYWPPAAGRAYTVEIVDRVFGTDDHPNEATYVPLVDPAVPYDLPAAIDEAAQPSTRAVFLREAAAALVAEVGPNGLRTGGQVEAWLNRYARDHG